MVKKRSIKCYQRMVAPKSDGLTCQLPVTLFLGADDNLPDTIRIDIHQSKILNLCVPYIAAADRFGHFSPLKLDSTQFPEIPQDTHTLRGLKMRAFRLRLPQEIADQYRLAAFLNIPRYDSIPAIESGSVIRELLDRYQNRIRLAPNEWRTDECRTQSCAV